MKTKKQDIIKFLGKEGLSSTSKIAVGIKANIYRTKNLLKDMEKDKKIKQTATPRATYWEVK